MRVREKPRERERKREKKGEKDRERGRETESVKGGRSLQRRVYGCDPVATAFVDQR